MSSTILTQSISIAAEPADVWNALIDPRAGERWRNADFKTDWLPGSPIEIEGMIGTKRYRDKGYVIAAKPPSLLKYSYWSRLSGLPDVPQSYSTITITVEASVKDAVLTVKQQVPPSPVRRGPGWEIGPESGAKHAAFYWRMVLPILKRVVEQDRRA
jgi:uncharacterized protein YndB with AHSA1/START domain